MPTITVNIKKTVSIKADVMVDGVLAKGYSASIDTDNPNDIAISEYISNKELYKANRNLINIEVAKIEDKAYAEQDAMIKEVTVNEAK